MYFYDFVINENKIVFPEYDINQIVEIDINSEKKKIIYEEKNNGLFFLGIYEFGDYYICSVYQKKYILILNKITEKYSKLYVENLPDESYLRFKHDDVIEHDLGLYIITASNDIIFINKDVTYACFEKKISSKKEEHAQGLYLNAIVYVPIENEVYYFKLEGGDIDNYSVSNKVETLFEINGKMYCSTNYGEIIDIKTNEVIGNISKYISKYLNNSTENMKAFEKAYRYEDKIVFIPCYSQNIVLYKYITNEIYIIDIVQEIENDNTINRIQRKNYQKYISVGINNNFLILLSSSTECLYTINLEDESVCGRNLFNDSQLLGYRLRGNNPIIENSKSGETLKLLIDYLSVGDEIMGYK